MNINEIAKLMVAKGKGILAADESTVTMTKRLRSEEHIVNDTQIIY